MEEKSEKSPFCHNFLLKERDIRVLVVTGLDQKTLTIGGSITVRLVSSLTGLNSAASQHKKTTYFIPWSSQVLLNLSRPAVLPTLILPPTVSVLWLDYRNKMSLNPARWVQDERSNRALGLGLKYSKVKAEKTLL